MKLFKKQFHRIKTSTTLKGISNNWKDKFQIYNMEREIWNINFKTFKTKINKKKKNITEQFRTAQRANKFKDKNPFKFKLFKNN